MKKIVLIGVLTVSLIACNGAGESTEDKKDSLDSVARESKQVIDSTTEERKDRIDSVTEAKEDSLERLDSIRRSDTIRNK